MQRDTAYTDLKMARNTFKQDENLEEPFNVKHLLRASGYIKVYAKPMIIALKANVAEIAATYQAAFPDDKILYASEKDF